MKTAFVTTGEEAGRWAARMERASERRDHGSEARSILRDVSAEAFEALMSDMSEEERALMERIRWAINGLVFDADIARGALRLAHERHRAEIAELKSRARRAEKKLAKLENVTTESGLTGAAARKALARQAGEDADYLASRRDKDIASARWYRQRADDAEWQLQLRLDSAERWEGLLAYAEDIRHSVIVSPRGCIIVREVSGRVPRETGELVDPIVFAPRRVSCTRA